MSHLTSEELRDVVECMYSQLMGEEVYGRWKVVKRESKYERENDFIHWLLDVAEAALHGEFVESSYEEERLLEGRQQQTDMDQYYAAVLATDGAATVDGAVAQSAMGVVERTAQGKRRYRRLSRKGTVSANKLESERGSSGVDLGSALHSLDTSVPANGRFQQEDMTGESPCDGDGDLPGPIGRYDCDICGRLFTRQYGLDRHKKTVHFRIKEFKCPECDKEFSRREYLNMHVNSHSQPTFVHTIKHRGTGSKSNVVEPLRQQPAAGQLNNSCSSVILSFPQSLGELKDSSMECSQTKHSPIEPLITQPLGQLKDASSNILETLPHQYLGQLKDPPSTVIESSPRQIL